MKLLVGLGNPGPKYERTRHNAGFLVLDKLAESSSDTSGGNQRSLWEDAGSSFESLIARTRLLDQSCLLLKPQTFMNLSGRAVQRVMAYFKLEMADLIVLHDDIDVPAGKVKARTGGGHGGNNGVRSIIECLGAGDFGRVKLGVGKPPPDRVETASIEIRDWVLQRFSEEELKALDETMMPEVMTRLRGLFLGKP